MCNKIIFIIIINTIIIVGILVLSWITASANVGDPLIFPKAIIKYCGALLSLVALSAYVTDKVIKYWRG